MKSLKVNTIILLSLLFAILYFPLTVTNAAPNIRVGLWTKQASILLSANEDFTINDPGTRNAIGQYKTTDKILLTQKNDLLYINDKPVKNIVLSVQATDDNGRIQVNRKTYRGKILIKKMPDGMTIVNTLPLEEYLYSVVPEEMPSTWSSEALKAQSVASRSLALYSLNRHENEGFDVCATTHCQVYGGSGVENDIATKAVNDTYGQVLLYAHAPIFAAFHASAGKTTENSEDVFSSYAPYLRAVKDFDEDSPDYHWRVQMSPAELSEHLAYYNHPIGTLQSITLSGFNSTDPDRSINGAIKSVVFSGDKGTVKLSGNEVRQMLNLKSTDFIINIIVPSPKKINVTIDQYSGYNKDIDVELPDYKVPKMMTISNNIHPVTNKNGEMVEIEGYGSGHRVGMSQWGAKTLADRGSDYQTILYTYYSEVSIGQWY